MAGYNPLYTQQLMDKYGVAWFKFDEASGNVTDSKGTAIGTVNGTTRVSGWNGNGSALNFNGTNSYVSFTSPVLPTSKKSIRFKIKCLPNTLTSYFIANVRNFNSSYKGEMFAIDTNGMLGYGYWNGTALVNSITTSISIADNQWHDILFTWDGTTNTSSLKLYVDNMLIPNVIGTATVNALTTTSNLYLGTQQDGISTSGRNLNGILDELEIYNEVINPIANKFLISSSDGETKNILTELGGNSLDPIYKSGTTILSNYNKTAKITSYSSTAVGIKPISNGKYYYEVVNDNTYYTMIGILKDGESLSSTTYNSNKGRFYYFNGNKYMVNATAYGASYATGDIISVLIDMNNGTVEFWKNGISQGLAFSDLLTLGSIRPAITVGSTGTNSISTFKFKKEEFMYSMPNGYESYGDDKVNIISIQTETEQDFITYGMNMNDLTLINPMLNINKKEYHQMVNNILGSGKIFEHKIDLNRYIVNKVTVQ